MVEEKRQMRNLLRTLKDKTSLVKTALSMKSPIHVAVIQATSHSSSPPSDHRVRAVLSLGRTAASACVAAVMDRLHGTRDAYVALKCLFMIHQIIFRGSFVIKEELSLCLPPCGGGSSLNMLTFRDQNARELSEWVRWYASVLEHNLMASRVLGTYFSSPSLKSNKNNINRVNSPPKSNLDVLKEIDTLVSMVVLISRTPESLQCQRNNLVYEIVNSVGEDYRSTQQQISARLGEFSEKIDELSLEEITELVSCLERLEECRENLKMVFVNRKRNNAFWDFVREMKMNAKLTEEKMRWVVVRRVEGGKARKDMYIPLLLF